MRNFKKFLTLVLAVMMVVSAFAFSTSAATQFTDVPAENEYLDEAVSLLNYMGIAKGVSETEFGTEQPVTRQQFALFIYRLMKGGKDAPATGNNSTRFTDLTDPTYYYAISWANSQGIVNGTSATTFNPTGTITLQDAYTMVVRALGYEENGETLGYPFGYIEVAEKDEVALDEGLDSAITATDELTRGDMAIILYNAFFAETGVAEIVNKERELSDGSYVLEQVEEYPTLCEKVFDVKEVEYQAIATPHYAMDGAENTDDLGYAAILFDRVDDDVNVKAPTLAYIAAEDINLDAEKLDEYFLAHFTMFVTLDEDDEIDSVLFADSNMTKKTVNDIKFATVTSNKSTSYFAGTEAKLLSGKATAGTDVFYIFDAPYSYANPTYAKAYDSYTLDQGRYMQRNAENIQTIDFALEDKDEGYFSATIADIVDNGGDAYEDTGVYADEAATVAETFQQIYYGGLYEADLYDVDGDGLFDYIDYKPYALFQVNTDDDYDFSSDGEADNGILGSSYGVAGWVVNDEIPEIYTNDATLLGETFEDEDFVIGYYDDSTNTIKVAQVLKPVTSTVKTIRGDVVKFADGTSANVNDGWKYVANFLPADVVYDFDEIDAYNFPNYENLLAAGMIDDDEVDVYVYEGAVLYQEGAESTSLKFKDNLIIPTTDPDFDRTFDPAIGERVYHLEAWINGEVKYVPVETEDVYPEIFDEDGNYDPEGVYAGELCTYSVGADGKYTIEALAAKENKDGDYLGISTTLADLADDKDKDIQVIVKNLDDVTPTKVSGKRFKLEGADLGDVTSVVLQDYTKIIIANTKFAGTSDEEVEYLEFDAETFNATSEVALDNVTVVLGNNVDSTTRENVVLLYGEANDFELKGASTTSGYRIVALSNPAVDDNGYYRNFYDVYNPFTGKKETDVPGSVAKSTSDLDDAKTPGTIVKVKAGEVDERGETFGNLSNTTGAAGIVWIRDYDATDKILDIVPVKAVDCWQEVDEFEMEVDQTDYQNVDGENFMGTSYQVDAGTVVTLMKNASRSEDFFKYGSISLLTVADLGSNNNEYKCLSKKVPDKNDTFKTGYAKYLKAYFTFTEAKNEEDLPTVDYVVIIANESEDLTMLATHTNKAHTEECVEA